MPPVNQTKPTSFEKSPQRCSGSWYSLTDAIAAYANQPPLLFQTRRLLSRQLFPRETPISYTAVFSAAATQLEAWW